MRPGIVWLKVYRSFQKKGYFLNFRDIGVLVAIGLNNGSCCHGFQNAVFSTKSAGTIAKRWSREIIFGIAAHKFNVSLLWDSLLRSLQLTSTLRHGSGRVTRRASKIASLVCKNTIIRQDFRICFSLSCSALPVVYKNMDSFFYIACLSGPWTPSPVVILTPHLHDLVEYNQPPTTPENFPSVSRGLILSVPQ